jgi:hypothetical protein
MGVMADIDALLADVRDQLGTLGKLHDEAMEVDAARPRFQARVKNILDNQRAVLDYLAVGITERYGTPGKGLVYFPIVRKPNLFPAVVAKKMPGVGAARADIEAAIESCQPYHSDGEWLGTLNTLNREQKHNRLTIQIVRQTTRVRVTEDATGAYAGWEGLTWNDDGGVTFDGGQFELGRPAGTSDGDPIKVLVDSREILIFGVPVDPATQLPHPQPGYTVTEGPTHRWYFIKPHVAVMHTLRSIEYNVRQAVTNIGQMAGL